MVNKDKDKDKSKDEGGDILEAKKKEEIKKASELKKKAELEANKKRFYTVRAEAMAPVVIQYRILARNPEEALKLSMSSRPEMNPIPDISKAKKIRSRVYDYGMSTIKLIKQH